MSGGHSGNGTFKMQRKKEKEEGFPKKKGRGRNMKGFGEK